MCVRKRKAAGVAYRFALAWPSQFATAEPLGERGRFWLAVHVANCSGQLDSLTTLDEREQWTNDHGKALLGFLDQAGERHRWQFLAAATEWGRLLSLDIRDCPIWGVNRTYDAAHERHPVRRR